MRKPSCCRAMGRGTADPGRAARRPALKRPTRGTLPTSALQTQLSHSPWAGERQSLAQSPSSRPCSRFPAAAVWDIPPAAGGRGGCSTLPLCLFSSVSQSAPTPPNKLPAAPHKFLAGLMKEWDRGSSRGSAAPCTRRARRSIARSSRAGGRRARQPWSRWHVLRRGGTAQLAPRRGWGPCPAQGYVPWGAGATLQPPGKGLFQVLGAGRTTWMAQAPLPAGRHRARLHQVTALDPQQPSDTALSVSRSRKDEEGLATSLLAVARKLGGGPSTPGPKSAAGARSTPPCRAADRAQGGPCCEGIRAVHETRLALPALPCEAVPLLLQLFGWVPDSRRKE